MANLSRNQEHALARLQEEFNHSPNAWHFASTLRLDVRTLRALHNRSMIERKDAYGVNNGVYVYRYKGNDNG